MLMDTSTLQIFWGTMYIIYPILYILHIRDANLMIFFCPTFNDVLTLPF